MRWSWETEQVKRERQAERERPKAPNPRAVRRLDAKHWLVAYEESPGDGENMYKVEAKSAKEALNRFAPVRLNPSLRAPTAYTRRMASEFWHGEPTGADDDEVWSFAWEEASAAGLSGRAADKHANAALRMVQAREKVRAMSRAAGMKPGAAGKKPGKTKANPSKATLSASDLAKFRSLMGSYQRDEALVYLSVAADAVALNSDYTASNLPRSEYSELTGELISIQTVNASRRGDATSAARMKRSNVAYFALQRKIKRLYTADSYKKIYED